MKKLFDQLSNYQSNFRRLVALLIFIIPTGIYSFNVMGQLFLNVSPTSLSLGWGSGTTGTFAINSNIPWSISDNATWLNVSPVTGTNNGTITVTANSANLGTIPRSALVTIAGTGIENKMVLVTQNQSISPWINKNLDNYWNFNRQRHAMAYIGDDRVLLFGGTMEESPYDGIGGELDDSYVYDLSSNSWQQLSLSTKPSKRYDHSMAYIGNNKVLLFGGSNAVNKLNDTWLFNGINNTWQLLTPATSPSARCHHKMVYIGDDKILLFGGSMENNIYNDTWIFDLSDNNWIQKYPVLSPSARDSHAMARIGDGEVILFGGKGGNYPEILSDTWIYNLGTNTWSQMSTFPSYLPVGRYEHSMAYLGGGKVILHGGLYRDAVDDYNETWIYDTNSNLWSHVFSILMPLAAFNSALAETNVNGGDIVLFGGAAIDPKSTNVTLFKETFIYSNIIEGLTLISPNGSENWLVGTGHNITWTSSLTSGNVRIEYSTNNGTNWANITTGTPDDGSYTWTIPNAPSTNCLIRISDTDGSPTDVSNAVFTISSSPFLIVSPTTITLNYSAGSTGTFSITSNTSWSITVMPHG